MKNHRHILSAGLLAALCTLGSGNASAQLSSNPDKFLGNITTSWQVDYGKEKFYTLWNQITCENESKWSQVEGTNNSFNWGCDAAYNYAKSHNFPFKFHALIWGSQYPSWLEKQTPEQRYKEIVQWMDAIKKKYPDLKMIDVVNEAVGSHQAGTVYFREALGGNGKTGYDWLIKAFELAYERWPDAILIYNDFNTFQWDTDPYIKLVKTLRDAGAPIDAYGCQSHDCTNLGLSSFKTVMAKLQSELKMPMYSTEYDIGTTDDALQLQRYKEQIPYMWEQDYCAGVTLWGYIYGCTWTNDGKDADGNTINSGHSGIIKNGVDRPAMTWLREYMKTDAAKNAKSPFPGMYKEASIYVKPESLSASKGQPHKITVRTRMKTKTIEKVELYVKNVLVGTLTEAPYEFEYTPTALGAYSVKAVVTTTDGSSWERHSNFTAYAARSTYGANPIAIPGTLQAENFDAGAPGDAYQDSDDTDQGKVGYRSNGGGVDIVNGATSTVKAIGYTASGEWLTYTVKVKEAGYYNYDAYVSANSDGCSFSLGLLDENKNEIPLSETFVSPNSGYSTYKAIHGRTLIPLEEGEHILRLNVVNGGGNIDRITFSKLNTNDDMKVTIKPNADPATVSVKDSIYAEVEADTSTIASVKFYLNDLLVKTVKKVPYAYAYTPTVKGTYNIKAVATNTAGEESNLASYSLKVEPKRTPYKTVTLPGIIEAENFDKGGEGFTFHDSDDENQGKASYRSDSEGVDIKQITDGYVIGYTAVGEWLDYTVNVSKAGTYKLAYTYSAGGTGSGFYVRKMTGTTTYSTLWTLNTSQTGNNTWENYKTVTTTTTKHLDEGKQTFRIVIKGANVDIDKLEFILVEEDAIEEVAAEKPSPIQDNVTYNIAGQRVGADYKGIVIRNGKKYVQK